MTKQLNILILVLGIGSNQMYRIQLIFLLLLSNMILANEIQEKTDEIIKKNFGDKVSIEFLKYGISPDVKSEIELASKQRFFSDNIYIWLISSKDSIIAFGLMDNVYGKIQPITFITFFNPSGKILSNHVIKYREEHGREVKNLEWNKQFEGLDKNSDYFALDGISGATISVNALKKGVMKLALLFPRINKKLDMD